MTTELKKDMTTAEMQALLLQLMAERNRPSMFRQFWDWCKPRIIRLVA